MRPVARYLVFCALLLAGPVAEAADAIGRIGRVQGPSQGIVEGITAELAPDDPVFLGETIVTGADARLEVAFDDGTVLTVGEESRLTLDAFVYQPGGESRLHAFVAGAFRFVSGKLATGETRAASVTTPFAVIGVRGTDFWGGPIDGRFGVVLFQGAVSVSNGGGSAVLDAPGQGVGIEDNTIAPGPVTAWPQAKVDRALATVRFR